MPPAVKFIGDRDKWAWQLKDTAAFNQGLKLFPHGPEDLVWKDLFNETVNAYACSDDIVEAGKTCLKFKSSNKFLILSANSWL